MKNKLVPVLIHVLCCLIFLSVPIFTLPPEYDKLSNALTSLPYLRDLLGYLLTVGFFYINYFYLIPRFYFRKKYVAFFAFGILGYLLNTALPNMLDLFYHNSYNIGPPPEHTRHDYIGHIAHNFLRFALVFFISLLVKINEQYKKMKKEKVEAELAYLKAQVNPHFLFNTLNTIYSLAIEQSDRTADAVANLSGMMRYALKESTKDHIPLEAELGYIQSYIDLQKGRFSKAIDVSYTVKYDTTAKQIAPMLLIPFIENAFKHGINAEEDSKIAITISVSGNELNMNVTNNIVNIQNGTPDSGTGIENTRSRLEMLYPARHVLSVLKQNNIFIVDLTINL